VNLKRKIFIYLLNIYPINIKINTIKNGFVRQSFIERDFLIGLAVPTTLVVLLGDVRRTEVVEARD